MLLCPLSVLRMPFHIYFSSTYVHFVRLAINLCLQMLRCNLLAVQSGDMHDGSLSHRCT